MVRAGSGPEWGPGMAGLNRLTVNQNKAAAPAGKLQDGGGLIFVTSAKGGRWKYRYLIDGKRREMGPGSYPNLSLAVPERNAPDGPP